MQNLQHKNGALQPWKHFTTPPPSTEMNTNTDDTYANDNRTYRHENKHEQHRHLNRQKRLARLRTVSKMALTIVSTMILVGLSQTL